MNRKNISICYTFWNTKLLQLKAMLTSQTTHLQNFFSLSILFFYLLHNPRGAQTMIFLQYEQQLLRLVSIINVYSDTHQEQNGRLKLAFPRILNTFVRFFPFLIFYDFYMLDCC